MYSQSVTSKCGFLSEAFVCVLFTVMYTGCNFLIQPIPFVWLFKWKANGVSFVTLLSFLKRFNFGMKLQGSIIWYQALLFSDLENCYIWNLSLCAVWSGLRIMHLHCTVLDISAVFTIFCNFLVPSKNSTSFLTTARSSLSPHPLHCWNLEQILHTRVQRCLWAGGGVGHVWIEKKNKKNPQTQICLKTFVHHCRLQVSDEVIILLLHSVDEFDSYIVVSFINATLVLSIGETVEEVTDSGFLGTTPTLSCSQLGEDALLQVIQRRTSCESLALLG